MTPLQIQLVQSSFEIIRPAGVDAAKRFFAKLFDIDPSLRGQFAGDIDHQSTRLMALIGATVIRLDDLTALEQRLARLDPRAVNYGFVAPQYASIGNALIFSLETTMDGKFTTAIRDAWISLYGHVAECIQRGARGAAKIESGLLHA